jgi:hypothetical protein
MRERALELYGYAHGTIQQAQPRSRGSMGVFPELVVLLSLAFIERLFA